jgi:nicotinamidase-related amidase
VLLLDADDCVLIVVDAQPGFSGRDDAEAADAARAREVAAWLVAVAAAIHIPIVATEEDAAKNGPTDRRIADAFPAGTPILAKPVFGLADVPEILATVEATGRRTAVLVGAETDVCVAHSALGLRDRGYRVAVVTDATFSPGEMHELGLRRIVAAGAELVHAKGVYYEWLRTLDAARSFRRDHQELASPPGFDL